MTNKQSNLLTAEELSMFFVQLSMMLKAGILPVDGISLLAADAASQREKLLLEKMGDELEIGAPLNAALAKAGCFPDHALKMVQIGEDTGRLEQVMAALANHYEQEHELRQSMRQVIVYPSWLAVIIAVVTFVLVTQVLPVFQQVLQQLGSDLSPWAASLLDLGVFSQQGAIVFAVLLLLLAAYLFINSRSVIGQERLRAMADKIFFRGKLGISVAREHFASAMSLSLASGLNINQALEKAQSLVADAKMKTAIDQCASLMEEGASFATAVEKTGIFSGLEVGLIATGFRSGSSENVMAELARRCHNQTEDILAKIMARIEPMLVVFLVVVVGMLLLSVMLPLLAMMNSIGG